MSGITRKPAFWIAYAAISLLALAGAWKLFPYAIPILHLDVRLSQQEAIDSARAIAAKLKLAPSTAQAAARFSGEQDVQNYVELEGGGKSAFAAIVAGDVYSPYGWAVRLFVPGEIDEVLIQLRPSGAPDGFARKIAETAMPSDPEGLALDAPAARLLAERRAAADWGVDFSQYKRFEQTQQARTTGRVDHTFVYERLGDAPGEARFRLRLTLAGDALVEVSPFVFIPESFERRFTELRSANNTIATSATLAGGLLWGLGGCVAGGLWLLRKRALLWRPALVAGFIVGGLLGLAALANAPGAWFDYDTAQSASTFWIKQIGLALAAVFAGGIMFGVVFMAAESLSRTAFPNHPQLWRVWSRDAAPTPQILGRTLGGYLFVPIELALVTAFYYATSRWLGWWQPSESLTDPNILGSAVPALAPIAMSLQAGFWEECFFRAVPLSLAALIGARIGHRTLLIGVAVVLQALIFAGAHASYPNLPAYARVVELIVPSIVWALIFLRFGLLPTVLLHALFDLSLFSIPLFLTEAPGSALQRGLVIAAALTPLAIVLLRRVRAGAWSELPPLLLNGGWRAPERAIAAAAAATLRGDGTLPRWIVAFQRALPALGIAGFAAWFAATPFRADAPSLPIDRAQAEAAGDAALASRGARLGTEWHRFSIVKVANQEPGQWPWHLFVWREAGRDAYAKLIGNTLAPPLWEMRYARFDGPVDDRAEEWNVTVAGDGSIRQIRHTLPEARPGARLSRAAAREIAEREIRGNFHLDPSTLKEVSAQESQRPNRLDWTFQYTDPRINVGPGGEARLQISIAGDEIVAAGRYVHIPETWTRAERERDERFTLLKLALSGMFALAALAALIMGIVHWSHGRCDRRASLVAGAITFAAFAIGIGNGWPTLAMGLTTAEPMASQIWLRVLASLFGGLIAALLVGLAAGVGAFAAREQSPFVPRGRLPIWALGIAAAFLSAGVASLLGLLAERASPLWPDFALKSQWLPWLGAVQQGMGLVAISAAALFILQWLSRMTQGWQRRGWMVATVLLMLIAGAALVSAQDAMSAAITGSAEGIVAIAIVAGLLRFDYRAVPSYLATGIVLHVAERAAREGEPAAWVQAGIAAATTVAVAFLITRYLDRARSSGAGY